MSLRNRLSSIIYFIRKPPVRVRMLVKCWDCEEVKWIPSEYIHKNLVTGEREGYCYGCWRLGIRRAFGD